MTGLAVLLLALSLCDLISGGLSGAPRGGVPAAIGIVIGSVVSVVCVVGVGPAGSSSICWVLILIAACTGWTVPRIGIEGEPSSPKIITQGKPSSPQIGSREKPSSVRAWLALAILAASSVLFVALSASWVDQFPTSIQTWLDGLAFDGLASRSPAEIFLGSSVVLFLSASANGVVRAILGLAGTGIETDEVRLRGGRFIGVIERYLIFGLAVAGEPTAAALVVSAKSILRFPELTRAARDAEIGGVEVCEGGGVGEVETEDRTVADVDVVTEYFLLGSLASWLLALAPVMLFR